MEQTKNKIITTFFVTLIILILLSSIGYAFSPCATFKGIKKNKIEYYEVFIGNTLILRFRDKGTYESPLMRTMNFIEKLNKVFKENPEVNLYDFKFNLKKKELTYKKIPLTKITREDIRYNNTELLALGLTWLNRLRIGILNTRNYTLGHKTLGLVSWYGGRFHGRKTAYGEIYNKYELTAASLKYPYNTLLIITNPKNKRKVLIRINDKGPYKKGRVLDLSEGTAYILGMKRDGVKRLIIQVIKLPK